MSGLDRERYGERKTRFLEPNAKRMPRRGRLAAIPDCTRVVKRLEGSIPILDGVVYQAVSPNWVDIVLVPAAQVVAVACHEAIRQRRPPVDAAGLYVFHQLVLAVPDAVVQSDHVRSVHEVAVQEFGGRTQGIACIHVLLVFRIRQPPVIAQSRNQGVGGLGMSGRILVLKALEAHPDLERKGLGQADRSGGLEVLTGAVGGGR